MCSVHYRHSLTTLLARVSDATMNVERPTAGWMWRQRRRLRRRRVLVVCFALSCLVVVQLFTWWLSDRWLDEGPSTHGAVTRQSLRPVSRVTVTLPMSRRCLRLNKRPAASLFKAICRNKRYRIPIQAHAKPSEDNATSDKLLSSESSSDAVVQSAVETDSSYGGRTESSTSGSTMNATSLASSSYNDTEINILYQDAAVWRRHLLAVAISNITNSLSILSDNTNTSSVAADKFNHSTSTSDVGKSYPEDLFSDTQLYHGAVILHAVGTVYMFVGLAIVCDEYFIPALEVITVRLGITEDVAGATLMAAGGSAPELFTSVIGVFVAHSDVGIGTIIGSAVFNVVFVIGACSLVSAHALTLTWWPLCRDVVFYCVSLLCLIGCFVDQLIHWWENDFCLFPKTSVYLHDQDLSDHHR